MLYRLVCFLALCVPPIAISAQMISAPLPQTGAITGTVEDLNGGVIQTATVSIAQTSPEDQHGVATGGDGTFSLSNVPSAVAVHLVVHADAFQDWTSAPITLNPGQMLEPADIKLSVTAVETSVNAIMPEQLAMEQVKAEEKQRIFGVLPNFYVVYDKNPMPLTAKFKFDLALKAATDP